MKTITFFKRVLASAALVSVCGFACATNNGKRYDGRRKVGLP